MKCVTIEWIDATKRMNDDLFNDEKDLDDMTTYTKTAGWLYKETKDTVLLVQEFSNDVPRDWVVIPRVLIKKIIQREKQKNDK